MILIEEKKKTEMSNFVTPALEVKRRNQVSRARVFRPQIRWMTDHQISERRHTTIFFHHTTFPSLSHSHSFFNFPFPNTRVPRIILFISSFPNTIRTKFAEWLPQFHDSFVREREEETIGRFVCGHFFLQIQIAKLGVVEIHQRLHIMWIGALDI